MVGWHHQLNGHEFEQTAGDSEGQGSLVCCSPLGLQRVRLNLEVDQQNVQNHSVNVYMCMCACVFVREKGGGEK